MLSSTRSSVTWQTSAFFTEPYAGLWPCNSDGIFSCTLRDCSNNFTIAGGKIDWNAALREDIAAFQNGARIVTSTQTATASPRNDSPLPSSENSDTISTAAAHGIGVGIGLPLFVAFLVMLAIYIRERRKNRRLAHDVQSSRTSEPPSGSSRLTGKETIRPFDAARSSGLRPVQELDAPARWEAE